ncbi:MAG: ABC transporter ATP-binding protein [Anaerolineales bacterium]|jgi:ABC-2 type transport system ATP-binding protein
MNSREVAPVIKAHDLTKRFGNFTAVDQVSFKVAAGDVVGYLGPNGSGKTTTIRMMLGLLIPTAGYAEVLGFDTVSQSDQVRSQVGYMSQKFALYQDLTVAENLSFYAGVYGVKNPERLEQVLRQVRLDGLENELVSALSTGWRQRVALGTAIIHEPQLLFLDEPTSGVDPMARRAFWDLIYELVDQGVTAFVTTHYMDEAEYCNRVGIMNEGRLLAMETPAALKRDSLQGLAWDVFVGSSAGTAQPLLAALETLNRDPGVLRAGLTGDHLRAVTQPELRARDLNRILGTLELEDVRIKRTEPTLEDVFLALAKLT